MTDYIEIAASDLDLGPVEVKSPGGPIGVFRAAGKLFAIDNLCPHAHAPLTAGHLDGTVIECAYHNARFHLATGRCLRGPGRDILSYPVRQLGGKVVIDVRRSTNPAPGAQRESSSPAEFVRQELTE